MAFSEKFIRGQLRLFRPFVTGGSLELTRKGQNRLGELMMAPHRKQIRRERLSLGELPCAWLRPRDEVRREILFYLHGGGYTCGGIEYAMGFSSVLACECGAGVFCIGYRLAPEHPYPAALEDALFAYRHLLEQGYAGKEIVLCGESAGGGLLYALCYRLRQEGLPLPAGLIAISPWTDLSASGESYKTNCHRDPSLTEARLSYYADCYTKDRRDPFVSPLFGDPEGLPPSLIFAGGDEIMLDDARGMHEKLLLAGCRSQLVVRERMWHAYLLYGLKEYHKSDFNRIRDFLAEVLPKPRCLRWMRLDNAAKIFPAARRRNWSNLFRLSVTLNEPVDPALLQSALDVTVRRFPSVAVRLRRGVFWYYLEEVEEAPRVQPDSYQPLMRMPFDDVRRCAFRVLWYENRIAVEFFHALTDGTGGLVFLKTLTAEYLWQKYGVAVEPGDGVLDRLKEPSEEELEDSFLKYAGPFAASRRNQKSYRLRGTLEPDRYLHLTCGMLNTEEALAMARTYGVTLTAFLTAAMIAAILEIQNQHVRVRRQKPVKVLLPVNLRKLFPSTTMRNFVMVAPVGVDPRMGEYRFSELVRIVHHQMGLAITEKNMQAAFTTNVRAEERLALRLVPLFLKNIVMKIIFNAVGERMGCLSLSNLGNIRLPEAMRPYVRRFDFVIGPQASAPNNCGVCSYGDTLCISLVRNTREPELERAFFTFLRRLGLHVKIESNERG